MIFCFVFVKIKNLEMTITSVNPFPLLVKFKDCYLWPNGPFMGRIPRDPRVLWFEIPTSIFIHFFKNIFMRFLRWIPFWLIIDDMIGWQKAERSDPTESDWVIISSHIFEKRILSIQNDFMVISDLIFTLKNSPSKFTLCESRVTLHL